MGNNVLCLSSRDILIWWYPECKSIFEKIMVFPNTFNSSSIVGIWQRFFTVMLFSPHKNTNLHLSCELTTPAKKKDYDLGGNKTRQQHLNNKRIHRILLGMRIMIRLHIHRILVNYQTYTLQIIKNDKLRNTYILITLFFYFLKFDILIF